MKNEKLIELIEFIDKKISEYKKTLKETQEALSNGSTDDYLFLKKIIKQMYYRELLEGIKSSENPQKEIKLYLKMFEAHKKRFEKIKRSWKEMEEFKEIELPETNEDEELIKILTEAKTIITTTKK